MGLKIDHEESSETISAGTLRYSHFHKRFGIFVCLEDDYDEMRGYKRGLVISTINSESRCYLVPLDTNYGYLRWDELVR